VFFLTLRIDLHSPLRVQAQDEFAVLASPGKFLVEQLKFLRHVPSWMPGAGFKHLAEKCAVTSRALHDAPFEWAEEQIRNGTASDSLLYRHLSEGDVTETEREHLKWAAGSIYGGKPSIFAVLLMPSELSS